jgi:carbon storage regulator CsrA
MLVLGRKHNESVVIEVPPSEHPVQIQVTIVDIDRGKTRLGFKAARKVLILRKELRRDGGEAPESA